MVTIIFQDGTVQEQILHRQADGSYTAIHGLAAVPVVPVPVLTRQGHLSKTTCLYQEVPSAAVVGERYPKENHEVAHLAIALNIVQLDRRLDALERQFHEFLDRNPSAAAEAQP
jgi:hypothetical protein